MNSASDFGRPKVKTERKKRIIFTKEEDEIILSFVEEFGSEKWNMIETRIKTRTSRQCRERWSTVLSLQNRNLSWTQEDDVLLEKLVEEQGQKWTSFLQYFPGKNAVMIKNRFSLIKRRNRKAGKVQLVFPKEEELSFETNFDFSFVEPSFNFTFDEFF
jgi:hypothetical protein